MRQSTCACALAVTLLGAGCGGHASPPPAGASSPAAATIPAPSPTARDGSGPVEIEMRNVRLHVAADVVLSVRYLRGQMLSRSTSAPPVFDAPRSYAIAVSSAEIAMDAANVTNLMNHHVFGYAGAPLSDVEVRVDADGRPAQKGKLHKGLTLPVSMKSTVGTTPDGRLLLHIDSARTLGIPTKGLLGLFGVSVGDLSSLPRRRGVEIRDNDVIISPGVILPPPEIRGRLTSASVVRGELVQTFGSPGASKPLAPSDSGATNYIYFSGASITFGKLTMRDADLELIDADPSDPFDFYPVEYVRQLVAGYSLNTPSGGLRTHMPDYDDASRGVKLSPIKR
jgi:hypothetical protein